MAMPIHLQPTAPLAERVLLPGDPGRALRLAQQLLEQPKMFNHNRGLWGYSGTARDGDPLTIQATGIGGPSAAVVLSELIELGARRLLRVGTCASLHAQLGLGALLVVTEAISDDGTSRALGAGPRVPASRGLLAGLLAGAGGDGGRAGASGPVVSSDLLYDAADRHDRWRRAGALAAEMQAATLFALAARRGAGVEAGCVLLVSGALGDGHVRIAPDELEAAEVRLGELGLAALGRV